MFRIDTSTAVANKPSRQPLGTPGFFAQGNPSAGIPFTTTSPDWANAIQEEIANVIAQAGISLSKADDTQLFQAIQNLITAGGQGANSGVATLQQTIAGILARMNNYNIVEQWFATPSSTTFVVPANVFQIEVWMVGGGGGGGDCNGIGTTAGNISAAGGGGGGFVYGVMDSSNGITPGASFPVVVGGGGQRGGGDGGDTTFNGWIAKGGGHGQTGGDRVSAGGLGGKVVVPLAPGQIMTFGGQDGSDGQAFNFVFAGNGGNSYFGGGGRAGNQSGAQGTAPGAGGGGAYDSSSSGQVLHGGSGQGGAVWARWFARTL